MDNPLDRWVIRTVRPTSAGTVEVVAVDEHLRIFDVVVPRSRSSWDDIYKALDMAKESLRKDRKVT